MQKKNVTRVKLLPAQKISKHADCWKLQTQSLKYVKFMNEDKLSLFLRDTLYVTCPIVNITLSQLCDLHITFSKYLCF